jgi:Mn2+/Fe2+ NRAMP family transporter
MTEPAERREAWDPVIFDALLTPQRSLSPRGFVIFMAAVCAASFVAGLMSVLAGAWPVVGFLGLDLVLTNRPGCRFCSTTRQRMTVNSPCARTAASSSSAPS